MASSDSKTGKSCKGKPLSQEQIVSGFQELRNQQKSIAGKISELDMERQEHDLVIDSLKDVDGDRKCFRMVGGVLVERTVKEVLPALQNNHAQLGKALVALNGQLEAKGKELNTYRENYNIRVRGEDDGPTRSDKDTNKAATQGVLVAHGAS